MSRWNDFLFSLSTPRVSAGNRVVHLPDDERTLRIIWESLDGAEERIWMSMYTLSPDEVGGTTLERLAEAARRGCEVLLVYDAFGSHDLKEEHLAPLRAAGGRAIAFNPTWPPWKKNLTIRNHRKLIIVDHSTAFCGGLNLTNDYAGEDFGKWIFDDTMASVEGPCLHDLISVFCRTWQEVSDEELPIPGRSEEHQDGVPVAILETDPRRSKTRLARTLADAIGQAQDYCYMSTPYFIPPPWLREALLEAARRGVDVHILTAGKTDRAVARWAGWHCYGDLLKAGLHIYELFGRILHSKTITIDGQFGSIGSYNMDAWTSRHTLDLNMLIASEEVAAGLEDEFFLDLDDAEPVTLEACRRRSPITQLAHEATYHAYRWL